MMDGISASSSYFAQMQTQGTRQRPSSEEKFNKFDADGNGTIDQAELQTMTEKIAGKTGMEISVEEVTKTYDANNDGLLAKDEMQAMMTEMRDKMGGHRRGQPSQQQSLAAYQAESEKDLNSILMEMLGKQAENQVTYTALDIQV